MCNLSKGVEEKGMEKGIQGMVSTLKDLNIPDDITLKKSQEKFSLTLEETQRLLLKTTGSYKK